MVLLKPAERARLRWEYAQKAISLALGSRWREAIEVNEQLLQLFPEEVEAHNRLGKAWMELGEYGGARAAFQKTLELVPTNAIARRNLEKLGSLDEPPAASQPGGSDSLSPHLFIEETAKTCVTALVRLSPESVLRRMSGGGARLPHGGGGYPGRAKPPRRPRRGGGAQAGYAAHQLDARGQLVRHGRRHIEQ